MPQIIINSNNPKVLEPALKKISEEFANVIELPMDKIFIAFNETPIYQAGEINNEICMIHIWWKGRSTDIKLKVVETLGKIIKEYDYKKVKITFLDAPKESIYSV